MTDAHSRSPASLLGVVLDERYRLDALLGTGGFGAVYRARHLGLDHDVAVKLLLEGVDAGAAKRLAREAKVLARLDHPNCVRVMDSGRFDDAPYLVLELVDGRPLSSELGVPWAPKRAVELALAVLAGLAHAHALGLVHRDLKPGNLLVADDPRGGSIVKIIDFGIVGLVADEQGGSFTEQLTATGKVVGTPRYMSPEQIMGGEVDGRSDLYSLGLILYALLAGRPPFVGDDPRELAWRHVAAPVPPLPDAVPDALAQLVDSLLAKKAERRPALARVVELLLELRVGLEHVPAAAPPSASVGASDAKTLVDLGLEATAAQELPGRQIDRFVVLRPLGEGGMGLVYLAYDERLDRNVAVKLLRPTSYGSQASARLVREARGLARVSHPNVVSVFEIGEHGGALFVAMEHVAGRTLRAWIGARPRSTAEILAVLVQAGRGLAAAHAAGLVHRDFKPDNVIVGDDGRTRVLDFGLVRSTTPAVEMVDMLVDGRRAAGAVSDPIADKLTRTGAIIGTPAYMALEQLAGDEVDALTDQFAFCVVAFEALYGQRPLEGDSLEDLAVKLTAGQLRPRPRDTAVPARVHEVIVRGLQVMPRARWPSMDALLTALAPAVASRMSPRRRALGAAAGGLSVVAIVAWGLRGPAVDDADPAERASASACDEDLEARNVELSRALGLQQAISATAQADVEEPVRRRAALVQALEVFARYRGATSVPPEVGASLFAVSRALHEGQELHEHGDVVDLAWAPAGSRLAIASRDGRVGLWDATSRELERTLVHEGTLASIELSDDGELLVVLDGAGRASVWHVGTGVMLGVIEEPGLTHARFMPHRHALAVGGREGISMWSLVRGRVLERGRGLMLAGAVHELAFVAEGARLLALTDAGVLWAWSGDGDELDHFGLAGTRATALAVAHDGARIALVTEAGPSLWDATTGARVPMPADDAASVRGLAFSPDARWLAIGARGRAPRIFDAHTGELHAVIDEHPGGSIELAFDPVGTRLFGLGEDGVVRIIDVVSGRVVDRIVGAASGPLGMVLDAGAERLATRGEDGVVRVWSTRGVGLQQVLGPRATAPRALALAPGRVATAELGGGIGVGGSASPQPPRLLESAGHAVALCLSPSAERVAAVMHDGRALAWDATSGARVLELPAAEAPFTRVALDDGGWLVTVDAAGGIARWGIATGEREAAWSAAGPVTALTVARDGRWIAGASGAWPAQVEVWTAAGAVTRRLIIAGDVRALAFSRDGQRLAAAGVGPQVEVWELGREGTAKLVLHTHEAEIHALAFSPDGTRLVVGGAAPSLWDLDSGYALAQLDGPGSPCRAVGFSREGDHVEVLRADASVLRWVAREDARFTLTCRVLERGPVWTEVAPSCAPALAEFENDR